MPTKKAKWVDDYIDTVAVHLNKARERDKDSGYFVGYIELYCDSDPSCACRTITIHFKEMADALPPHLTCPACRKQLKVHSVRTMEEHEQEFQHDARCSVNTQRWVRDNKEDGPFVAVPVSAMLDDTLPA